jgi:hypothetical protein
MAIFIFTVFQGIGFLTFSLLSMLVMFLVSTVGVILGISWLLDTEFYLMFNYLYKVSQELRSIFRDLIPELMLTKTSYTHGSNLQRSRSNELLKYSK